MSLNDLFGAAGAKPKQITTYTTGSGVYIPTADQARCYVELQASGGGGCNSAVAGGGGGAKIGFWVRVPIAGLAYAVPASGAVNTDGSKATFGTMSAQGGKAGTSASSVSSGAGGLVGAMAGAVNSTNASMAMGGIADAYPGGAGGNASNSGNLVGFPANVTATSSPSLGFGDYAGNNGRGAGSGGDSFFGKGNPSNTAPDAAAYGAGGGYFQAGSPGVIRVYDYGV